MAEFRTVIDIANRALQHCGATRIDETLGFNEQSKRSVEVNSCYGQLRRAELQQNTWIFAIRRAILRPIDVTTGVLSASSWSAATTYFKGAIITDINGLYWESKVSSNLNHNPIDTTGTNVARYWELYCGPRAVSLFNPTLKPPMSYFEGELVYMISGANVNVYRSLVNSNTDVPTTATPWNATTIYQRDQVVAVGATPYVSLQDFNLNQPPATNPTAWDSTYVGGTGSIKWLLLGGTLFPNAVTVVPADLSYPVGTGPSSQSATRNIFMLPANFLREAPQDPKAGSVSFLGMPGQLTAEDWTYENNFIVSRRFDPIPFRFVADVTDVHSMGDMFCEGLGLRIAHEIVETLSQSSEKKKTIQAIYKQFMGNARTRDGIEAGPIESPLDDYITTRI